MAIGNQTYKISQEKVDLGNKTVVYGLEFEVDDNEIIENQRRHQKTTQIIKITKSS